MIEFINRNPGVTALCAVLVASGVLLMVFSALLKRQSPAHGGDASQA